jgi:hypothetical protein
VNYDGWSRPNLPGGVERVCFCKGGNEVCGVFC